MDIPNGTVSVTCVIQAERMLIHDRALDSITSFETLGKGLSMTTSSRYAVRQIMDQEHRKFKAKQDADARQARFKAGGPDSILDEQASLQTGPVQVPTDSRVKVKKDFFGRLIKPDSRPASRDGRGQSAGESAKCQVKVWVTFNEGFSDAVRKPITVKELFDGL